LKQPKTKLCAEELINDGENFVSLFSHTHLPRTHCARWF